MDIFLHFLKSLKFWVHLAKYSGTVAPPLCGGIRRGYALQITVLFKLFLHFKIFIWNFQVVEIIGGGGQNWKQINNVCHPNIFIGGGGGGGQVACHPPPPPQSMPLHIVGLSFTFQILL